MAQFSEKDARFFRNFLVSLEIHEESAGNAAGLKAARHALRKLELGRFGDCEECGEEIPFGRLRMNPENPICHECEHDKETELADIPASGLEFER